MDFKYSYLPGFSNVITEYTINGHKKYKTLYSYIKHIIECYMSHTHPSQYTEDYLEFYRNIEKTSFDTSFTERLLFYISTTFYTITEQIGAIDYLGPNQQPVYSVDESFKKWCTKWQVVYDKHKPQAKALNNFIIPFQKKFLKKIWNPHTTLGLNYAIYNMNKLPWNDNNSISIEIN